MKDALANPLPRGVTEGMGIMKTGNVIVYRLQVLYSETVGSQKGHWIEYVMPYCPWCGARLRMTPAQREEKRAKAKT